MSLENDIKNLIKEAEKLTGHKVIMTVELDENDDVFVDLKVNYNGELHSLFDNLPQQFYVTHGRFNKTNLTEFINNLGYNIKK